MIANMARPARRGPGARRTSHPRTAHPVVRPVLALLGAALFVLAGLTEPAGATTAARTTTTTAATAPVQPYGASVTLSDGRTLLAGGCLYPGNCPSIVNTAYLHDPVTKRWTRTTPMLTGTAAAGALLLPDGRVLVASGCTSRLCGADTNTAQIYNPTSRTWTYTGPMPFASSFLQVARLADGRILAAGGNTEAAASFNPSTSKWTAVGSLHARRGFFTMTLLPSGQVLAAGGCIANPFCIVALASSETFNPTTGQWTTAGPLHNARFWHTATLLPSGKVLVTGGDDASYQPVTTKETYDPATRRWTLT